MSRLQGVLNSPFVEHVKKYRPDSCTAVLASATEELLETLFDAYNQACQVEWDSEKKEGKYDHMCLSTWEGIQDLLVAQGVIREDQCLRK